jgi:hypothetical protein
VDGRVKPGHDGTRVIFKRRGQIMKQEDLKEMAQRCRLMADTADEFTRKRLLDLALKYEARYEGRSLASKRLSSISVDSVNTAV